VIKLGKEHIQEMVVIIQIENSYHPIHLPKRWR